MEEVLQGWIRHLMTAVGGAGVVVSDDLVIQIASTLVGLAGFAWSAWQKRA